MTETKKKKSRDELVEDILFSNIFKCFKENDQDNGFKYLYALKMWRKLDHATEVK